MAKQNVTITEDDRGFLLLKEDNTENQRIIYKGWYVDQSGVLIKKTIETKNEYGTVIGTDIFFEFQPGATIYEHCVDDKITSGDLVGGNI